MSQAAAQHTAAGSDELNEPIDASISVASEYSSSRTLAYVRSSSLTSTRSGRSCPIRVGTSVLAPDTSISTIALRTRPRSVRS
jgi:hypothetical protein